MITRLDFRGAPLDLRSLRERLPRGAAGAQTVAEAVRPILAEVRDRGGAGVQDLTERFDGVRPDHLLVPETEIDAAVGRLAPEVRAALEESIRRQRRVSAAQLPAEPLTSFGLNATVRDRWRPVDRVGFYIPGGRAVYPSTVVMNAVPAQTAGVESIVIASPPGPDGLPHADILAGAGLLGLRTVLVAGGAQAIAALAYGLPDVLEPVDLITGPGNAFVAAAKAEVRSFVGIDSVAGPTEVIILADATADPEFVAADLISQAEHDPEAAAVLVTDDAALIEAVARSLAVQVPAARHAERIAAALAGEQSGLILVDDLDAGVAVVNAYAGEHVEVMTADPAAVAERIRHGGAIFLGSHSPVSLGDYCSGSNHVLPTLGGARHTSGLGATAFLRRSQIIDYDRKGLAAVADHVRSLAEVEQLPAHGAAVDIRFRGRS